MRLLVVDGIFGPQTERAVRTFQHTMGLYADGVVGPLTRARLLSAQPRRSATPTRSTSTAVPQAPTSMLRPTPARTAIAPSPTLPPQARADPCTGIAAPTNVAATDPNPLCVETSDIMHLYLKGFTVGQEFRYYVTTPGGLMRGRPRFGHIGAGPLGNGLVILASGTEFGPALLPGNYVVVIEGLPAATPRASAPFRILP
jgi:hypothetical protein